MTNDELKKKIAQIIADYFCPQGNEHKKLWGDGRLCYSKMNFAECEWVTECTDALIAAGIGDVSCLREHRVIAEYSLVPDDDNPYIIPNVPLRVAQLYSGEEVEKIAKDRKELKDELRSKVEYIHEQDEVIKEYKHRAEVAERALKEAVDNYVGCLCRGVDGAEECRNCNQWGNLKYFESEEAIPCAMNKFLQKAERELAEGNGGQKEV